MIILYNNLADTATISVTPSPSLGSAANLQNNRKSSICRTIGTTTTYTLIWSQPQEINAVALPATNLLHASTIDVDFYSTSTDITPFETISDQAAVGRSPLLPGNIKDPDYRYFSLGGAAKTFLHSESIETSTQKTRKLIITLTNPGTGGQIDCSRIVCGKYWQPSRQASNGITISTQDNSEISTTRSGDNYINTTYIKELMNFELRYINDADRQRLLEIFRSWGTSSYIYVSVFPDSQNPELTQTYSIYGRNNDMSVQYDLYSIYTTNLSLESW